MKKQIIKIVLLTVLFCLGGNIASAADVNLTVRDGASIVFSGAIPVPTEITSLNDATGAAHDIDPSSVLSILASADQTSDDFSISNLTYFDSFGSLYLKCITDASGEKCDNWQYTVNDAYPGIGMDKNILSGGENVYVYFGPQNKVVLSSGNIKTNEGLAVLAQKYDYENDIWMPRTGVTVGLTQPDPDNPYSPIEIQTSPVDENGKATFSRIPAGSYGVGVKEDFYFPAGSLVVTEAPPSGGGGGGNSHVPSTPPATKIEFDLKKAFDFLIAQQKEDGSFGEDLYTDWAAIALASGSYQANTIKLTKFFEKSKIENGLLTDYERHTMALMALGLNPYSTNNEDYIEKINAGFDGKQFGDPKEDNDDIFALIILQNAGYNQNEKMITDDVSFVLGGQKEDGSWDESVDLTGAAIEALSSFNQNEQMKNALVRAENFLKQNQKENGGWNDNVSSTTWAIEGILALGEKPKEWKVGEKNPLDYLADAQDADGGIKDENLQNKIWETSYVISALSGKTWNQTMQKFEKPKSPAPTAAAKITAKKVVKKEKTALTAAVINAASPQSTPTQTENSTPKRNWFLRLIDKIFSVF